MKKAISFVRFGLTLTLIYSNAFSQGGEQQKQFPEIPARPIQQPTVAQDSAWQAFQNLHPSWEVRWSRKSGVPASLMGLPTEFAQGSPEEIARQFLSQYRSIFKMKHALADLHVKKIENRLRAIHIIFQQTYEGIPVEGGVYAVHLMKDGKVYLANGDYFDDVAVPQTRPALSMRDAIQIAKNDLGSGLQLRNTPTGKLAILPYGADYRLAWKITVPAKLPKGEWIYFISAQDGSILSGFNSADFASGTGSVYDRHPEAGSVVNRTLTNLSGNGYSLNGTYVQVFNEDDSEAYETDNTFIYNSADTHFDEVMVYYHINRFQDEYLDNLGYPYLNYPGSLVKAQATVHVGTNWNNAGATPPNILQFGDGDGTTYNDFAKEDDVIYHEYLHLVTEHITTSGLDRAGNFYDQTDAMDEAFSDYFGASYAGSPLHGEYVRIGSQSERELDNSFTMSDWDNITPDVFGSGDYHNAGQIFSGALWDLRDELGQPIADILAFEGLDNLDQSAPDFQDGRDAIIAADNALYNGAHVCTIKDVFGAREIGEPGYKVMISGPTALDEGQNGTWTATITCGSGTYEWRYRDDGGAWSGVVSTSSNYSRTMPDVEYFEVRVDVTDGSRNASDIRLVYRTYGGLPKISDNPEIPKDFALAQNYPNPFNPSTEIQYQLKASSQVRLTIYNLGGHTIRTLVKKSQSAGYYSVVWDGKDDFGNEVASGIYLYRINALSNNVDQQAFIAVKKMTLLR